MTGSTLNVKGVKMTTPVGVGVDGGELTREQKALQTASDAAIQADHKFTRLCTMLPSFTGDRQKFYRARDQMFDLIAGTNSVASVVAVQTGQAPPAQPIAVPTVASAAAAKAGINPAKGVANPPAAASTVKVAPGAKPTTVAATARKVDQLKAAATKLKKAAAKKPPASSSASHGGREHGHDYR